MRQRAWTLLAMANVVVCCATGSQLSIAAPGRMHARHNPAYLPLWWWRRQLTRRGLRNFRVIPSSCLTFCAEK
jgi:hypothetical protein